MRALRLTPGAANSAAIDDIPEPPPAEGPILVETIAVGVCGTDVEIVAGNYGAPPPGQTRLVLGHEALGRVLESPAESGLAPGDLAVPIVRRPDPVPCPNCAIGEWDMCRNGKYTEHGIKGVDGFCRERFRTDTGRAVKLDPALARVGVLLEPASVVAKAWEHIDAIGSRARWTPRRVLVTGAGPIGLLAALMGVQRKLDVHVLDRVTTGPKPELVRALHATYHSDDANRACQGADIIIECTGAAQLVFDAMQSNAPNAIVCLTGLSSGQRRLEVDMTAFNRSMVLENDVVFGSVNANRRHYETAAEVLAAADREWLERVIARRVPLDRWQEALRREPSDVKTIIEVAA